MMDPIKETGVLAIHEFCVRYGAVTITLPLLDSTYKTANAHLKSRPMPVIVYAWPRSRHGRPQFQSLN